MAKCLDCGSESGKNKYCDITCMNRYHARKRYDRFRKNPAIVKCAYCGKETNRPKYCSRQCTTSDWKRKNNIFKEPIIPEAHARYATKDISNMTTTELQQEFHCTHIYIQQSIAKGMPSMDTPDGKRFNLVECQKWHRREI